MLRIAAIHLAAFLAPFVLWVAYAYLVRGERTPAAIRAGAPLFWLVCTGLAATIALFIAIAALTGAEPSSVYRPAELRDGVVVPGEFAPPDRSTGQ